MNARGMVMLVSGGGARWWVWLQVPDRHALTVRVRAPAAITIAADRDVSPGHHRLRLRGSPAQRNLTRSSCTTNRFVR